MTISDICDSFDIGGKYISCEEISTGNINKTYRLHFIRDGLKKDYIIQRINKNVFKEPDKVMENIVRVTEHVRAKIRKLGISTKTGVLRAFNTKETKLPYFIDENGDYWRCYRFIKGSVTYDTSDDLNIIKNSGTAFGLFQNSLGDFDAKSLNITIPDFHNTKVRFEKFHEAVDKDELGRVSKVRAEVDKLLSFEQEATILQDYLDKGLIPYRVTHNDTKCNNVSFDKHTGQALAVLDLDTVMPGAIAHDFGDAIRFIANTLIEDSPDFEKVALDINKYEAFTSGYVPELKHTLTDLEKETLNLGVFSMTVELATRFLTDYILGDTYFKTRYPGHNVDRAKNQIALAEDIKKKKNIINDILKKYI